MTEISRSTTRKFKDIPISEIVEKLTIDIDEAIAIMDWVKGKEN